MTTLSTRFSQIKLKVSILDYISISILIIILLGAMIIFSKYKIFIFFIWMILVIVCVYILYKLLKFNDYTLDIINCNNNMMVLWFGIYSYKVNKIVMYPIIGNGILAIYIFHTDKKDISLWIFKDNMQLPEYKKFRAYVLWH